MVSCRGLCALAVPAVLTAAPALQAPWADWRTLATAHYRIHYPPALADWAGEVAGRIEAIHDRVTALVGYASPGPIQVVLADPAAEPNGLAVPLLGAAHVVLWRTEPQSDSQIGGAMNTWTEELLAHELTHIHHLTRPRRPGAARSLFSLPLGPLLVKSPRWLIEGYATLMEGRVTGSGRPHSAIRAAVLRQWASAGKLPAYSALNRDAGYLGSSMAYLAGSAYLEWLERQRPDQPDILQRLWKQLARDHRSFQAAFQATFGFSAQDGYQRFQAEASNDALEWEARIKAQGLREGALWLRVAGGVADLGVSPDGTKLLARLATRRNPGLRVWDLTVPPPPAAPPSGRTDPFNAVTDAPAKFTPPTLLAALPSLETPVLPLTFKGEQGSFRGNPREAFQLGGVTTSLVPASLDLARVEQPALPAHSATGDRFLRWRGQLGGAARFYAEGTALWRSGQERGPFQRVLGLEFAPDLLAGQGSEQALKRMQIQLGVHRPLDGTMKGRTVATLTLMLRP